MLGLDIDFSNTEDWWRIKVFASDVRDGTTTTTKTHQKTMSCCDAATWRNLVLLHDMATWINHFDTCTMHLLLAVGSLPRVQQSRTCTRIACLIEGKEINIMIEKKLPENLCSTHHVLWSLCSYRSNIWRERKNRECAGRKLISDVKTISSSKVSDSTW